MFVEGEAQEEGRGPADGRMKILWRDLALTLRTGGALSTSGLAKRARAAPVPERPALKDQNAPR